MTWTAIVPLKHGWGRKSRLAASFTSAQRQVLADRMAGHVIQRLSEAPGVTKVFVLSVNPCAGAGWIRDQGRGLNEELDAARAGLGGRPVLVLHADLPLLQADDIAALANAAADAGAAIAPDRVDAGTNGIAIADGRGFRFSFGHDSFARHRTSLGDAVAIVRTPGLQNDLDTPSDLDALPENVRFALTGHLGRAPH